METQKGERLDEHTSERKQRKPYVRPELVQYGALQEITRDYTNARSCRGAPCING
jgi:hypothetical protein